MCILSPSFVSFSLCRIVLWTNWWEKTSKSGLRSNTEPWRKSKSPYRRPAHNNTRYTLAVGSPTERWETSTLESWKRERERRRKMSWNTKDNIIFLWFPLVNGGSIFLSLFHVLGHSILTLGNIWWAVLYWTTAQERQRENWAERKKIVKKETTPSTGSVVHSRWPSGMMISLFRPGLAPKEERERETLLGLFVPCYLSATPRHHHRVRHSQ